ncbi:MAG TPA: enoyl-CoA hydratase-related protein [Segeticoccus sp.]|nr:enoyl-CoA hydratase-related protein [Segeticoccus sp.]
MNRAVRWEQAEQGVLLVTLDRSPANAVDVGTSHLLHDAFTTLRDDPALRVAVLTGAGDRFFCAGWDLKAAAQGEAADADHGPGGFAGLTELFDLDKPVIAAVNGLAIGGGFELALAADLLVAADDAEFALPEVRLGLVPDSGGMVRLPRRLPRAIAAEMLLTGRRMPAEEASRWGLVNRVVPGSELREAALALAREVCSAAPLSVAAVKEVTRATEAVGVAEAFAVMRGEQMRAYHQVLDSEDATEGARAFAEKRPPEWTGR